MSNLTSKDLCLFERLKCTFENNFRITRLYAAYIEHFPEIITEELVSSITDGGRISKRDAICALLCEFFGLDVEKNPQDKMLYREYITKSVRILDAEKYRQNPYYKNVKLTDTTYGSWEIKRESYEPYRAVICDDMIFGDGYLEVPPLGFFTEKFDFPAVLEDGNEWMTLTPVDMDTCDEAIAAAHGKVITFGLGLGYYAYMVSLKGDVESVTVIEKNSDVISLFKTHILPYFPHPEKIRIINDDAFEYAEHKMPTEKYTYAFVDTWRDASDGAPMYKKMKPYERLNPDTVFSYWIENFLISRLRALKYEEILGTAQGLPPVSYDEFIREIDNVDSLIK